MQISCSSIIHILVMPMIYWSEPMFFGTAISWQEHIEHVKIGCHLDHAAVGSNHVTQNNEPFFYD